MTCTTPTARRRKTRSPRLANAVRVWSEAMAALALAADACDLLAEAMGDLLPDESDPIHGDDVREDAWHAGYFIRSQLSLIESSATADVVALARGRS